MKTTEISSTRKAMFSMEAYCPSQDCNPHESICAKPRIEFICATHCANPTGGVRAFGVGQMLCRQVVVLQWQCQAGNSRRSVGACGSRQGVLKYGFSRDTRLCRARCFWHSEMGSSELLVQDAQRPSDQPIAIMDHCLTPAPLFDPACSCGKVAWRI